MNKEMREEYKSTLEAYKEAKEEENKELMKRHGDRLIFLGDMLSGYSNL